MRNNHEIVEGGFATFDSRYNSTYELFPYLVFRARYEGENVRILPQNSFPAECF